jgi:outer membrane protein
MADLFSMQSMQWLLLAMLLFPYPAVAQSRSIPTTQRTEGSADRTGSSAVSNPVQLTLPDLVTLLLQNNRELKNAALDRIVQRQELREAERTFSPRVTPLLGIGISQALSGGVAGSAPLSNVEGEATTGNSGSSPSRTAVTRTAQITGEVRSPLGTSLAVTVDPFQSERIGVTVTQPLLRGAGRQVNEAPVNKARLTETRNQLEIRKTLMEQITQASITYRALAKAQEALRIQQLSLENQRQVLAFTQVLVNAGRRARSELVEIRASLATTETQLLEAQNNLAQAKSDLVNLLDLEDSLNVAVPQTLIAEFQTGSIPIERYRNLNVEQLLLQAYANRPEYQQAQLDIQVAQLDQVVARDNQRWSLNARGTVGIGDQSQATAGVTLSREFGNESLNTARRQSEVDIQKRQNDLARIQAEIRLDVGDRLRDVNSALNQIAAAQQAKELTQQRLAIATERFRRGRGTDIFQVLDLQNNVVAAQNEEVNAKISFLDAVAKLDQSTGVTLDTWQAQVEASQLLNHSTR